MPIHPRALVVAFICSVASRAGAQQARVRADTGFVPWSALTGRPDFTDAVREAVIQYPDMMRAANVEGTVRLRMIIGSDGAPEPQSLKVDASTHDMFSRSVERAVLQWRLAPPTLRGSAVRAQVPLRVEFLLPQQIDAPLEETNTIVSDSAGVRISLGWNRLPRTEGLVADSADVRAVTVGVMVDLLKKLRDIPAGFACVSWHGTGTVPSDAFKRLSAAYPDLRNANQCPPSFHSMIGPIDPNPKVVRAGKEHPRDPVWISASNVRQWTSDLYVIQGSVIQGTLGQDHYCEARRAGRGAPWVTTCEYRRGWVS